MKIVAFGMILALLLTGMLTTPEIRPAKAYGDTTIYIRADGSMNPPDAPIATFDNVTYTFTGSIYDEIVVERDNIIIDGAGYTVQGMETGSGDGILLSGRKNVTIRNVQIKGFLRGIYCYESSNDTISGNNITNNLYGIHFASSSGSNIVANNIVANDPCGIYFYPTSDSNSMIGNNITSSGYGILTYGSSNNSICNNNITDHSYGIAFAYGSNNRISGNAFRGCGIHLGLPYGNIVEWNSVNGKPLVYLENMSDYTVDNAGQVILVRCNNIRVENLNLSDTTIGLELWETNNSRVSNNNITANKVDGIFLLASSNNTIEGNNVTGNLGHGINFYSSSYNTLRDNNLTDNFFSILVEGPDLLHFVNDIDISNTVNGSPIYYWIDQTEKTIPSDAGYVALVNCTNITVHDLDLRKNACAVLLAFTANSTITRNNMTANDVGIHLINSTDNSICDNDLTNNYSGILLRDSSNDNVIADNNMTRNYYCGIVISSSSCNTISGNNVTNNWHGIVMKSSNNSIYHNNFFDNSHQFYTYDSTNIWDNGYPSGGNYWSDYTGVDLFSGVCQNETGGDGMGDAPYAIDVNNPDNYPLVHPYGSIHNLDTNLTYLTIQSVINAPETLNGHTIFVKNGMYYEHVVINKSISLVGENRESTIIDGNFVGSVVEVTMNNVTMTGFTVRNSGWEELPHSGIVLIHVDNCKILDNRITNNDHGIWLNESSNINISENYIEKNYGHGIYLDNSHNNTIVGNDIAANDGDGIAFEYSNYTLLYENTITANGHGIWIRESSNNNVFGNNVMANSGSGLYLEVSSNNSLTENKIANNDDIGVVLYLSINNSIEGNAITANNNHGIYLYCKSEYNQIIENTVADNHYGIRIENSNNSVYHNSFINNTWQVDPRLVINAWDDGYPSGGNYWSDYTGIDQKSGYYQNETGSDGMGDTPYVIDANNQDNHPLMKPYPWNEHDIGITYIGRVYAFDVVVPLKTVVGLNYSMNVDTFVMGYGANPEVFNATIYANESIAGAFENVTLAAGNSTILSLRWNTTGLQYGNYTIRAVASNLSGETDLKDNIKTNGVVYVGIPGDVNGDGKVDVKDIAYVARRFGLGFRDSLWNPNADINDDGKIDVMDVAAASRQFGEHYP